MNDPAASANDTLARLASVIDVRSRSDVATSYVARLLAKGPDAVLKKIGEEATEVVMACKDGDGERIVAEVADLWFHTLIALHQHGLVPADVLAELERREGRSGLDEFAARKMTSREEEDMNQDVIAMPEDTRSLKTIGHISYFLHAVVAIGAVLPGVQASVLILLIAFFIDMWKRDAARGTWQESHFSWRIRSVLWAGALYLVTAPLWLLFLVPGWIAWSLISLWFLYRIARGWLNLSSNTPMPS